MKASKFTEAQKAFVIKQGGEGMPVAEICRKAGISQATYFAWKKKYAGPMPFSRQRAGRFHKRESANARQPATPTATPACAVAWRSRSGCR
jgi:putative transposase